MIEIGDLIVIFEAGAYRLAEQAQPPSWSSRPGERFWGCSLGSNMTNTLESLQRLLVETLELGQPPEDLDVDTALFGALPELDSFGVVQLVAAIEEQFDITIDDDEHSAPNCLRRSARLQGFVQAKHAQT